MRLNGLSRSWSLDRFLFSTVNFEIERTKKGVGWGWGVLPVIHRMGDIFQSILQLLTVHDNFRVADKHSEFLKVVRLFRNLYRACTRYQALG